MKGFISKFSKSFCCMMLLSMLMCVSVFADVPDAVKITAKVPDGFVRPITINFMSETGDHTITLKSSENFTKTISLPAGTYDVTNVFAMDDTKGTYEINCDNYYFTVADGQSEPIPVVLTVNKQSSLLEGDSSDKAPVVEQGDTEDPIVEEMKEIIAEDETKTDETGSDAEDTEDVEAADEQEVQDDSEDKERKEKARFIKSTIITGSIFVVLGIVWVVRTKLMD